MRGVPSAMLKKTFDTLAGKYKGETVSRLSFPIFCAIGRCDTFNGTLPLPGWSDDDVTAMIFFRMASTPLETSVALINLERHEVKFLSSGGESLKRLFRLGNSEIGIIKDAVSTFFGVQER